jgi:hypothetical protein
LKRGTGTGHKKFRVHVCDFYFLVFTLLAAEKGKLCRFKDLRFVLEGIIQEEMRYMGR